MEQLHGGTVFTAIETPGSEYLPNKGVFLRGMLTRDRGDAFGFYRGTIEPGSAIAREIHAATTETIYILEGDAVGLVGEREVPLHRGQVLHVEKNVPHGIKNVGTGKLEILVIGNPDF